MRGGVGKGGGDRREAGKQKASESIVTQNDMGDSPLYLAQTKKRC